MLWRVHYKKALGLIRATATEPDQEAALERAFDFHRKGYRVLSVGTDAKPRVFGARDVRRLFAVQRAQGNAA